MNDNENWKSWEIKAKGVYKDSLALVKQSLKGLEVVAGKTVEVTKVKLDSQRALARIKNLFMELGQRVYDVVLHQKSSTVTLNADIISFVEEIKKLKKSIEDNVRKMDHLTVVDGPKPTKKSAGAVKSKRSVKKAPKKKKSPPKKPKNSVKGRR